MRAGITCGSLLLILFLAAPVVGGQSAEQKPGTASVRGQVTLGGKPRGGALVLLTRGQVRNRVSVISSATTDMTGVFHLQNLNAGKYYVTPVANGFLVSHEGFAGDQGKGVTLAEGEAVEGIDFTLTPGGVISGRITDRNHQPIIDLSVLLIPMEKDGTQGLTHGLNQYMFRTDDRGVYRLYGLPAGRYKLCAGEALKEGGIRTSGGLFQRTFHPGVADAANAEVIEVAEGGEVTGVDFSVQAVARTYTATFRMIEKRTGAPVGGMRVMVGPIGDKGQWVDSPMVTGEVSDEKGEFRLEGLLPGRYFLDAMEDTFRYRSDRLTFEIKDANLRGLEVSVRRRAGIGGIAVLEGSVDADVAATLPHYVIFPRVDSSEGEDFTPNPARIGADGRFQVNGLAAGKARLRVLNPQAERRLSLLRIEHNGVEVKDGFDLKDGEQVTGVRLVMGYGSGVVRGQIKYENGALAEGAVVTVVARRIDPNDAAILFAADTARADGRGRFLIEHLPPGDYELSLVGTQTNGTEVFPAYSFKQRLRVTEGGDVQVTITADLGGKEKGRQT